jgi:hypothetical protein
MKKRGKAARRRCRAWIAFRCDLKRAAAGRRPRTPAVAAPFVHTWPAFGLTRLNRQVLAVWTLRPQSAFCNREPDYRCAADEVSCGRPFVVHGNALQIEVLPLTTPEEEPSQAVYQHEGVVLSSLQAPMQLVPHKRSPTFQ